MTELATTRLSLRAVTAEDTDAICALYTNPEVTRYTTYRPTTMEECRKDLITLLDRPSGLARMHYHLALRRLGDDAVIGWCGLDTVSRRRAEAELGYGLSHDYWGQGYMTEATRALLSFGRTTLRLHRIFATCHAENRASERVLQKLGMRLEGRFREHRWNDGEWSDSLVYAVLGHAGEPPDLNELDA